MYKINYLYFTDTAKFALVAREIANHFQFATTFNFWNNDFFNTVGILPVYPYILSLFFKLFGISDVSILITSFLFFFLTGVIIYLLALKLTSKFVGLLTSIIFLFSPQMIEFAKSGASETLFIFEIVLGLYLTTIKNKWANVGMFLTLFLIYFTRPLAFIYILGILIYYLFINFNLKKASIYSVLALMSFVIIDTTLFSWINGKYFIYSTLARGIDASVNHMSSVAVSDSLRGGGSGFTAGLPDVLKKVFYNLYNFYKAMPQIMNPYLFFLFVLGSFTWGKNKPLHAFKISVLFMVLATLFVTALTIPFYRYIHPIIPLVYIVAISTLVELVSHFKYPITVQFSIFKITKQKFVILISTFIIVLFAVGQTLGLIFLDSRYEKKLKNTDKAPIYVEMSNKLKEITNKDMVIVTNLDTWGSWYGERKTIWFPLDPEMILTQREKIEAIYLTSYKIDDQNYYMGEKWREIFLNPETQSILTDYKFVGEYKFNKDNNYEKQEGRAILLIRKE